ncbi:hypothetical protein BKA70DRAFT_1563668 [Coprinopsis sp. MPI-PUGE-AT-0042]|nr:hypothetical protein BKA70DRAFT_1563668 [Coprinopsis sp. MPI-PUGE-AT-0042]
MRFVMLLTSFILFTLASALVVPPRFSKRATDLYTRQIAEDIMELEIREPSLRSKIKGAMSKVKEKVTGSKPPPKSFSLISFRKDTKSVPQAQVQPPNFKLGAAKNDKGQRTTRFREELGNK